MSRCIAVHGHEGFAQGWAAAAASMGLHVRMVDAYGQHLWTQLEGCDALLWNIHHDNPTDLAFARSILLAAEQRGLRVFPDHPTAWHFDDKVAQKYLLESIDAPLAETWVFFGREDALRFLETAEYPIVFKLRRGAGSLNVRLVLNRREAASLVRRMFGRGIRAFPVVRGVAYAVGRVRLRSSVSMAARGRRVIGNILRKVTRNDREFGYVLFQKFVQDNNFDTRVTVIGDRAFTFRREVRDRDFRASGSGRLAHLGPGEIAEDFLRIAFDVTKKLGTQSLAFDFVRENGSGEPRLLEISYSYVSEAVTECPGYFTRSGNWRAGHFDPAALVLADLINGASDEAVEFARRLEP